MKNILFIFFFLIGFITTAQEKHQYRFKRFDVEDGLSQNSVNDIFQDSDGYIWIATQEGLNRYDGYTFTHFRPDNDNPYAISDFFIWGLLEDHLGYLWFCSRNGLNRMNRKTGEFIKVKIDDISPNQYVLNISLKKNNILVLFGGNKAYEINLNQVFSKPTNYISQNDILCKELIDFSVEKIISVNDTLFIHKTSNKIIVEKNNKLSQIELEKSVRSLVMYSDALIHNGRIWIADYNGLSYTDYTLKSINKYLPEILSDRKCNNIEVDFDQKIWVGTDSGVFVIDTENNSYSHILKDDKNTQTIPSNFIQCIYRDKENNIWIGTAGNGLCVYNPEIDKFKYLSTDVGIKSDMFRAVCYTSKDKLWISNNKGIEIISFKNGIRISEEKFLINTLNGIYFLPESLGKASCIKEDKKERIWLGIIGKGLHIFDENNKLIKTIDFKSDDSNYITDIVFDKENNAWITTYLGIYKVDKNFDVTSFLPSTNPSIKHTYFLSAYIDLKDNIWFGHNFGFCKLEKDANSFKHYFYKVMVDENSPSFNFITSFQEDKNGNLWLSTYGGGINKFDIKSEKFTHYNTKNGLINNNCGSLIADNKNNLWVATNDGISCFNTLTNNFTNYNTNDGVIFKDNNLNASFKNKYGELFFCTAKGIVVFNPEDFFEIETSKYKSPMISNIQVNYESLKDIPPYESLISLNYDDKVLSIEFVSLNFKNPKDVMYAFKMEGVNKDWVYTNYLKRIATYSTLPDGNYKFLVKAKTNNSDWSEPSIVFVKINPPFWKTWWFISILFFSAAILIYTLVKYFISRKLKERMRQIEIKENIQKERIRISRDLHDNVGASITYLISSLDNIHYQAQKDKADPNKIDQLSDFARNTMRQLRETIWVMDKDEIELNDFKSRLIEFSLLMMSSSSLKIQVLVSEKDVKLKPTIAINLFRIIQEVTNNAIKHANAKTLIIDMKVNDKLKLSIKDDGTGFNMANIKNKGYGLNNITDRCKEMNAECIINSIIGEGTSIKINLEKF